MGGAAAAAAGVRRGLENKDAQPASESLISATMFSTGLVAQNTHRKRWKRTGFLKRTQIELQVMCQWKVTHRQSLKGWGWSAEPRRVVT